MKQRQNTCETEVQEHGIVWNLVEWMMVGMGGVPHEHSFPSSGLWQKCRIQRTLFSFL